MRLFSRSSLILLFLFASALSSTISNEALALLGDPGIPNLNFKCPNFTNPVPPANHVTRLNPSHISVIMAAGDSITAGFSMLCEKYFPLADFLEYRGLAYAIGGDEYTGWIARNDKDRANTVARWLMNYNPRSSTGVTLPLAGGKDLNAAISMARIQDVSSQIEYLVNQLTTTYRSSVDMEKSWKLLTIAIGANNVCAACHNPDRDAPMYEKKLREILDLVRAKIPRVFVNIPLLFNISGVYDTGKDNSYCSWLWTHITTGECPCMIKYGESGRQAMDEATVIYNKIIMKVAAEYSSAKTGSSTFTVVAQPFASEVRITQLGSDYLSDLDCFHPSLYANEALGLGLWNNMFQAPGQKSTSFDPQNVPPIICPNEDSYLQ